MRFAISVAGALLLALACAVLLALVSAPASAGDALPIPPSGVIGTNDTNDTMFAPEHEAMASLARIRS